MPGRKPAGERIALIDEKIAKKKAELKRLEAQKEEIDLDVLIPLAEEVNVTFFVFSNNRTYIGNWEDYGYEQYGSTDEFQIYARKGYEHTGENQE